MRLAEMHSASRVRLGPCTLPTCRDPAPPTRAPRSTPIVNDSSISTDCTCQSASARSARTVVRGKGDISRGDLLAQLQAELQLKTATLNEIAARQRAADEKRKSDTELAEPSAGASESAVLQ